MFHPRSMRPLQCFFAFAFRGPGCAQQVQQVVPVVIVIGEVSCVSELSWLAMTHEAKCSPIAPIEIPDQTFSRADPVTWRRARDPSLLANSVAHSLPLLLSSLTLPINNVICNGSIQCVRSRRRRRRRKERILAHVAALTETLDRLAIQRAQ